MRPLVSLIALNYNQTDITCEFLESTRNLTYPNYEIIVIDNGSTINPKEQIEAGNYPKTRLIVSEKNLGFTGGNYLGMREANGDFIFIVNNDTEVTEDLLDELLAPFSMDENVGVVSPKIKFFHHPDIIQYAGFKPINPYTGRTGAVGSREKDEGQHNQLRETFGAHGAAMMGKRSVIEDVGMFADNFFIYYEEWDWSARIRRAGYKIYYQPNAVIYHKESITMGKESAIKAYYHTRNRILFMRRNSKKIPLIIFTVFFTMAVVPKSLLRYLRNSQFEHIKAFAKGVTWNLTSSSVSN
ncbi:MAG: glycosyltransferase family 2 protein [Cyclobacteriaceae bacterium]